MASRSRIWFTVLVVSFVALALMPIVGKAEPEETGCHPLLTSGECATYRAALRRSRSVQERAKISQDYARLVREREEACPCPPGSLQRQHG